jgi:hypothetical protein
MAFFALAGFLVQAYLTPNVAVQAHRDAAGHVSADVAWKCVWDLVTIRRLHIEDFEGAEVESLGHTRTMTDKTSGGATIRLRLRSKSESWIAQLMADDDDVRAADRRLNAFRNCINCDPEDETTVIRGARVFRWVAAGLMLFGGSAFVIGLPVRLFLARKPSRSAATERKSTPGR